MIDSILNRMKLDDGSKAEVRAALEKTLVVNPPVAITRRLVTVTALVEEVAEEMSRMEEFVGMSRDEMRAAAKNGIVAILEADPK
jgi:hypothetical protein